MADEDDPQQDQEQETDDKSVRELLTEQFEAAAQEGGNEGEPEERGSGAEPAPDGEPKGQEEGGKDGGPSDPVEKAVGAEALAAPAHWSAADKETFGKVPREAQQFLLDRHAAMERDHTAKTTEIAPLRKAASEWNGYLTELGTTPADAFKGLLRADRALRTGPRESREQALIALAKSYGIELEGPGAGQEKSAFEQEVERYTGPLQQRLDALSSTLTQRSQADEQRAVAENVAKIETFRDAKADDGSLLHPHFGEVIEEIKLLTQRDRAQGLAPDLESIYERAVWMNPSTRAKAVASEREAAKAEVEAARKARVEKARRAGASVPPGGGTPPVRVDSDKSVRELLQEGFARYA